MPRGDQLARQWQLLQKIDRPQGVTVEDAARDLGCAVRTIWRDLRVLENAGFPIYSDPARDGHKSVWRVDAVFKQKLPLKLTLDEIAALLMTRDVLAPLGLLGASGASAHEKIVGILSRDALAILDRMRERLGVRAGAAKLQAPAAEHVPRIHQALMEHRTLRTRYYSMSRDEERERAIDPYHLTAFDGGLYLIGHCHWRNAVRIFAVERLRSVEVTRSTFTPPRDFDAAAYLEGAWGIIRGDLVTVKVVFARSLARYIRERLWHPSQRFRDLDDGRLEVTLRVADTLEVRRWILGYGLQAEVIAPESLREALRKEAEALAARLTPGRAPLAAASKPRSTATRAG
ncbi:MAG TPA: WYL domain-containing protein [Candidatus Tectomicrobia bacterium]|nr:WYL domain-containing protein [Candidatus Tectomicrobia bacterium]